MDAQSLEIVLPRFSHVGYAAVTLLLASGCTNALVLLPRPEALITTDYGRVLLVKIADEDAAARALQTVASLAQRPGEPARRASEGRDLTV